MEASLLFNIFMIALEARTALALDTSTVILKEGLFTITVDNETYGMNDVRRGRDEGKGGGEERREVERRSIFGNRLCTVGS